MSDVPNDPNQPLQSSEEERLDRSIRASIDSVTPPQPEPDFWSSLDQKLDRIDDAELRSNFEPQAVDDRDPHVSPDRRPEQGLELESISSPAPMRARRGRVAFLAAAAALLLATLGIAWVLGQGSGIDPAEGGEPPEPSTLQAEEMVTKTGGEEQPAGWAIWRPGYIEDQVFFPQDGTYEFVVIARGRLSGGNGTPDMELLVDFVTIDSAVQVQPDRNAEYRFVAEIEAGTHDVAISNAELSNPTTPGDTELGSPDLIVDRIEIRLID